MLTLTFRERMCNKTTGRNLQLNIKDTCFTLDRNLLVFIYWIFYLKLKTLSLDFWINADLSQDFVP